MMKPNNKTHITTNDSWCWSVSCQYKRNESTSRHNSWILYQNSNLCFKMRFEINLILSLPFSIWGSLLVLTFSFRLSHASTQKESDSMQINKHWHVAVKHERRKLLSSFLCQQHKTSSWTERIVLNSFSLWKKVNFCIFMFRIF